MQLFLSYGGPLGIVNIYQAQQVLQVNQNASFEEIKDAYRKLALRHHPDKNDKDIEGVYFKKVTEAYHFLKSNHKTERKEAKRAKYTNKESEKEQGFNRAKWGAGPQDHVPEEDWSKFTREFEEDDPGWWKEYERKFWDEYNYHVHGFEKGRESEKTKEPKKQPNLFVDVDQSLCIGCCSCEIIAPDVFELNRLVKSNPKSRVINPKGAGVNRIMNAAETCPTKAIIVENIDTNERMYPF